MLRWDGYQLYSLSAPFPHFLPSLVGLIQALEVLIEVHSPGRPDCPHGPGSSNYPCKVLPPDDTMAL